MLMNQIQDTLNALKSEIATTDAYTSLVGLLDSVQVNINAVRESRDMASIVRLAFCLGRFTEAALTLHDKRCTKKEIKALAWEWQLVGLEMIKMTEKGVTN
jgi:hypothetical protein